MKSTFQMEFVNVPASSETAWNSWLDNTRVPACIDAPGVYAVQRFVAIEGNRKYFNFLGLDDIDAAARQHHSKLRDAAMFDADMLGGAYSQIYPAGGGYREPGASTILVIGHDIAADHEDEYHAWYETEHIPVHLQLPGFLHAYRFVSVQGEPPPGSAVNGPRYITMYEVDNEAAFRTPEYESARHSPWTHWMRRFYTQRFRSIFERK